MYNFPTAAPLGMVAALVLLVLGGIDLWHFSSAGTKRLITILMAGAMFALGGLLMSASISLGLTQLGFTESVKLSRDLPETSVGAVVMSIFVVVCLALLLGRTLIARNPIAVAGTFVLFCAALAVFSDVMLMHVFKDAWALTLSLSWIATAVAFVVFLVTVAVVKVRTYGARQFEKGKMAGLDAAQYIPSNSR